MSLSEEFYAEYEKLCDEELEIILEGLAIARRMSFYSPSLREACYETGRSIKYLEQERERVRTLRKDEIKRIQSLPKTEDAVWVAKHRPEDVWASSGRIDDIGGETLAGENDAGNADRMELGLAAWRNGGGVLAGDVGGGDSGEDVLP